MNKSHYSCFKRWMTVAGVLVVLASVTAPGVFPVQASPPKEDLYFMHAGFMTAEPDHICLWKKIPMEGYFSLISRKSPLAPLAPLTGATVNLSAKLGNVTPTRFIYKYLSLDKIEIQNFTYTARKVGHEVITIQVTWDGAPETKTIEFDVRACKYKVHGSVDLTKVSGAMMVIPYWQPMGTYDVSGTIVASEDSIHGVGTTNLFQDAIFTGGGDIEATCTHNPPWEGASTVEMDGDVAALADNGSLDLKFTLEPMVINATKVVCQGEGGGGYANTPEMHIPSFDLDFDPLSADGGATARNFHFPSGKGEFEIELTVSPEAES
jgi:hypothetical protein